MKRKKIFTVFLLASFLLSFSLVPVWAKGVTLTWFNCGAIESDPATTEILKAYEQKTGNKVKIVPIPGPKMVEEYYGTMARGESTFDVMEAIAPWLPDSIHNNWIAPLDDVISVERKEKYSPGCLEVGTGPDGKLYAIPWFSQPHVVFYRADLVGNAGYGEFPNTLDDFATLSKKLTVDKDGDGMVDQYGFVYAGGTGLGIRDTFFRQTYLHGGRIYDKKGNPLFNAEPGVEALQFLIDLKDEYKAVPETVMDYQEGDVSEFWQAGLGAIMWNECGHLIKVCLESQYGEHLKLAQLPSKDGKPARSLTSFCSVVVNAKSRHVKEAKELASWIADYYGQWLCYWMEFNVPTYQAVFESPYLNQHVPFSDAIKEAIARAVTPTHRGYAEVEHIVSLEARNALMGKKSAEKALDDAVAEIKKRGL